jgi:uncharacterized protein DUF4262
MALDPRKRKNLSKGDQDFLRIIDKSGWHIMYVAPREKDPQLWWGYSTGIFYHWKHPEIVLFNLDYDSTVNIINGIGGWIKNGGILKPGKEYSEFFSDCKCIFRPVLKVHSKEYLCWSDWFYERKVFPTLQCFWPDAAGIYPWNLKCDPQVGKGQLLLYKKS